MHIGLKPYRLADILRVAPVAQELLNEAFPARGVGNGDAGHNARLAQHLIALTDIVGAGIVEKV